jgi:hypothetical protein
MMKLNKWDYDASVIHYDRSTISKLRDYESRV